MYLRLPGSSTRECFNASLFSHRRLHQTQYEFIVTASDSEISYSPSSPPFMFSQIFPQKVKKSGSHHLSFIHIIFQFKSIHVVLARCLISIPRKSATPCCVWFLLPLALQFLFVPKVSYPEPLLTVSLAFVIQKYPFYNQLLFLYLHTVKFTPSVIPSKGSAQWKT